MAVALYKPKEHRALAYVYGQDPKVSSLAPLAWVLWELGYPDQAIHSIAEALSLAQELTHPYSIAFAHGFTAWIHQYRQEALLAQQQAEATITLSDEHGVPLWSAWGKITKGWAMTEQGLGVAGIEEIHHGQAALLEMGAELQGSYFLALLADAYRKVGDVEAGLRTLAEALAFVERTGERYYEAELYRLKGELTLLQASKEQRAKGKEREAEGYFLKAIDAAQKQHAKSLELRAVMSLVRLRQQQAVQPESRTAQHAARSKLTEAHQMLSAVYNWFTEGFDTKDLQEAKALLETLETREVQNR
jgi:adenylate cyclase